MDAMFINRFQVLYSGLQQVDRDRLDLSYWRSDGRGGGSWFAVSDEQLHTDCGTTACAVGWACSFPELQEQGLSYVNGGIMYMGVYSGWGAIQQFFGVSYEMAQALFTPIYAWDTLEFGERRPVADGQETDAKWLQLMHAADHFRDREFAALKVIRVDAVETDDYGRIFARLHAFAAHQEFEL